ncbi:DUF1538 domain-containing protein [Desulfurispira natronophila]|uniref:DUF1538 domain-containing protein n=1 Tax=Desulfurispira natronophila TaxID=682562 RepID=A0A7W7Y313_9BACT|nr:DUF1538 domain-containing protein [Desulfurispira natronophila]MBB5021127.1 hypothetical protein [Desulfurispira natronophila]
MDSTQRYRVTFSQAVAILAPYLWSKLRQQLQAVLPIVAYLFLFQLIVLQKGVSDALTISGGMIGVLLGLMLFMEGLRVGLMPLGEAIGAGLPKRQGLPLVLGFAFILGIGSTLAEPAIGALQSVGMGVDPQQAPLLYYMLAERSMLLALCVGAGVGVAVMLGIIRFIHGFSLKFYAIPLVGILALGTMVAALLPDVEYIIGLAWDCGAVTTGPVTVPLVLALGLGVSRVVCTRSDTGMSGFGIITLASLFPIAAVLILGIVLYWQGDYVAAAGAATLVTQESNALLDSLLGALRAIVPLVTFLFLVQWLLIGERLRHLKEIVFGIVLTILGMALFNLGLLLGLVPLGDQVGSLVPATFSQVELDWLVEPHGALYGSLGIAVAILFAFFLGYGATLAEPALAALGEQVENLTNGAFKKRLLIQTVAFGVGSGIALGITKVIFNLPLSWLLLPAYGLLLVITVLSTETITNIGWDAAGVTTGPITVPLVIAMGLGVGSSVPGVVEGFGILALASVFPILSVLSMGLLVRAREPKGV